MTNVRNYEFEQCDEIDMVSFNSSLEEKGESNTWEIARKIEEMSIDKIEHIFGVKSKKEVFDNFTVWETKKRLDYCLG